MKCATAIGTTACHSPAAHETGSRAGARVRYAQLVPIRRSDRHHEPSRDGAVVRPVTSCAADPYSRDVHHRLTFMPFGVPSEYSCSEWSPTGSDASNRGPAVGLFIEPIGPVEELLRQLRPLEKGVAANLPGLTAARRLPARSPRGMPRLPARPSSWIVPVGVVCGLLSRFCRERPQQY